MNYIPNSLIAGTDISLSTNTATLMLEDGQELTKRFKFSNDCLGVDSFVHKVNSLITLYKPTNLKIGIESTNLYWWHLFEFLDSDSSELILKPELYLINPNKVSSYRKSFSNLPKADPTLSGLLPK